MDGFIHEENRIYLEDAAGRTVAEITFPETSEGIYTINHTYVDDSLRGQGIASRLVQAAVEDIAERGGKVRATCSYAVRWLERNSIPEDVSAGTADERK